jgi:hypothetical protein
VTIAPSDAPEAWRDAVSIARDHVRRDGAEGDCGSIAVEVSGERASVVFTTLDGRSTTRRIDSPEDLGALVDALLVTLPREEPVAAPPLLARVQSATADHAPETAVGTPARLSLRATAGTRISSPGAFASPSFGASAGVILGAWEVSAFGLWDPVHTPLAGPRPSGFTMSRYAVGVALGRRVAAGATAIAIGLSTSVAVTSEAASADGEMSAAQTGDAQTGGATAAEPLVAAYVGVAYPRQSSIRFRPELSAEVVASRIGRTLTVDPALPPLPWWSGAATMALEWELR